MQLPGMQSPLTAPAAQSDRTSPIALTASPTLRNRFNSSSLVRHVMAHLVGTLRAKLNGSSNTKCPSNGRTMFSMAC